MKRRTFIELAGLGLCNSLLPPNLAVSAESGTPAEPVTQNADGTAYGSGYFGEWITDSFGLPAYRYTCNQVTDPKAVSSVDKAWRAPTDHTHLVGNDRIVAAVSNYGYVQVRQDEGSPKYLNDYSPEHGRFGGGVGFLRDEDTLLSTYYSGNSASFDRVFGMGYLRKNVTGQKYQVDQVVFAPFGDDPVLVSQVTITNRSDKSVTPRWVEYWGCHNYQFSYRSLMESAVLGDATSATTLRRAFSDRFAHHFRPAKHGRGLVETQTFRGRAAEEEEAWQKVQAALQANPNGFYGGPVPTLAPGASMDDLQPPPTFLVSLDAPADGFATNSASLFEGGIEHPQGMARALDNDLGTTGPASALILERGISLKPGESLTLYFLYGYLPEGFDLDRLTAKYAENPSSLLQHSGSQWKGEGIRLRINSDPWVERETAWSSYYLRSGITYDSFFREHILSQGAPYQYIAGLQGAARDPLQHVLPFVFSNPNIVREVIRYTIKEMQPDGSLPYGIVGSGVPMPCRYRPSDLQLWLLWLTAEYILATRESGFLDERVPLYPEREAAAHDPTIREHLARAFTYLTTSVGVGEHGLMRMFNGDWNDSVVVNRFTPSQVADISQHGESVLNAAMASYVLDHYARMLRAIGSSALADEARAKAEAQRQAVRKQWTGQWFRRAWLGEKLGWSGNQPMWLEPQPWAILGGCPGPGQQQPLIAALDARARRPSPIGALLQSEPDPTMKDEPGVGTNGGVFAAINGTLVWALAQVDGAMAWDEWKKNTLARHAAVYPEMWFGIWSGPDAYNSVLAKNPGSTGLEFPVMNMHPHAWPLYSAAKLLGLEFREDGISFRPLLPLSQYEFSSSLLGFTKSHEGAYSGWYAPATGGTWKIQIVLSNTERTRKRQVIVNEVPSDLVLTEQCICFSGQSEPGKPLKWRLV